MASFFLIFSFRNFREGYFRAGIASLLPAVIPVVSFVFFHGDPVFQNSTSAISLVLIILFSIPHAGKSSRQLLEEDGKRHDERDTSFSRNRLQPGSENYLNYYSRNPENEENDSRTRALPGLLSRGSRYFHRYNAAAAEASFYLLSHLRDSVEGAVFERFIAEDASEIAKYLKSLMKFRGVSCYAVTALGDHSYYTHSGRNDDYGAEITRRHRYAIVLGSEMRSRLTATAPFSPEVVETGSRYVDCAVLAVQAASFIRNLGYSARAHIDGNYQLIPPMVADDAGLGGFGWNGLFLTKKFGPRVRFSVVTTDLELPVKEAVKKTDFLSFCNICRKCAVCCPGRAISRDKLEKLNADRCFKYWNAVGTDCGRCLAVCPMGHPWGILKTLALRSLPAAILLKTMDDLFYGRKPGSLKLLHWMGKRK